MADWKKIDKIKLHKSQQTSLYSCRIMKSLSAIELLFTTNDLLWHLCLSQFVLSILAGKKQILRNRGFTTRRYINRLFTDLLFTFLLYLMLLRILTIWFSLTDIMTETHTTCQWHSRWACYVSVQSRPRTRLDWRTQLASCRRQWD